MLPFLLPSAFSVRASSRLAQTLSRATAKQESKTNRRASTATLIQAAAHSSRSDGQDQHDDAPLPRLPRHNADQAAFSHFFDKRTPLSTPSSASTSSKPKASHEIASASRQAVATFREAIGRRQPAVIIEAYDLLLRAQQIHARDVIRFSSRTLQSSDVGFPVRKADIQTAIRHLVQHAQAQGHMEVSNMEACHQMFHDMSRIFGFRIGPTDLHRQLQTYCLSKSLRFDPCQAFERLRASHPDWQTTSVEWNMVISYLVKRGEYGHAIKVWNDMLEYGVEPEDALRNTMIRVQLAVKNTDEAETQLQHISLEKEQLGIDTLTTTVEGLCKLVSIAKETDEELMGKLRTYASDLRKAVESSPQAATDSSAWHALLRYEAMIVGPAHALETARLASKPGMFGHSTLCFLLRLHVDELNDLQSSDEALELLDKIQSAIDPKRMIQLDDQCYNILMLGLLDNSAVDSEIQTEDPILLDDDADVLLDDAGDRSANQQSRNLPTPNQVREAQLLYDHVRALGIPPTPLLVTPLLTAYCEAFLPSLPSAMKLVQDMLDYRSSRKASSPTKRRSTASLSIGMKIIRPVLDACVKVKDITAARTLLSRLHEARIAITAAHKSQLMRRLIGITTSWPEAFHIYRSLSRFPTTTTTTTGSSSATPSTKGLDERGYIKLLESFRSLKIIDPKSTLGQPLPAPPEELLGIVEDMRAAGHRPSCAIYTSILDYYAKTPKPSYLGVRATHEMLKRDERLEPDLPLINALMNAYNRAEEPAMVLAIWDSLLATRQEIDGITLSVFFDTAGRHGLLALARKAISTVRRIESETADRGVYRRSAMSKGAWDSWLECLARCGRLEEAIELAFGEMRRTLFREAIDAGDFDSAADQSQLSVANLVVGSTQAPVRDRRGQVVGPDAKTLGTLLKFAARERDRRQKRLGAILPWSSSSSTNEMGAGGSGRGNTIWHSLRARIREELSWLYPQVKHIGENPL
ncbi:uncharacterized protein UTRI_00796_B [Ustilago trichophora]|uniref:Uncharacterized protein n=1 Tax=Ustilago trichophora TaxID=86804 RepID=A0A5C3DTT1_9BASI|nr:uncharacterized protein UTRI_00796_B [Ustilago trichophora]